MIKVAILLSFVLCTSFCFTQQIPDSNKVYFDYLNKEINSGNATAQLYCNRARIYFFASDTAKGLEDIGKVISLTEDKQILRDAFSLRGSVFLNQMKLENSLLDYQKAVELDPKNENSLNNRGFCYYSMGNYSLAIQDFELAIKSNNKHTTSYVNLIALYKELGDIRKVEDIVNRLVENVPEPKSYIERADYFQYIGKLNLALSNWNQAVELSGNNPDMLIERSKFKDDVLNNEKDAIADCRLALKQNPHESRYYYMLARPFYDLFELDSVRFYCTRAIELDPSNCSAIVMRANALDMLGKGDLAKTEYERAILTCPEEYDAYRQLAIYYISKNEYAKALQILEENLKHTPKDVDLRLEICKVKIHIANNHGVVDELMQISNQHPSNSKAAYLAGYLCDSLNDQENACFYYYRATKLDNWQGMEYLVEHCESTIGTNFATQYKLLKKTMELEQSMNYSGAIDVLTQLIAIAPDSANYYYNMGRMYRNMEQYEKAIGCYDKGIKIDSTILDIWISKAISLSLLEKNQEAIEIYQRVLEKDPYNAMTYYNLGLIYAKKKDYIQVAEYLRQAIQCDYKYVKAYMALGECYVNLQDFENACKVYTEAENIGISEAWSKRIRYCR